MMFWCEAETRSERIAVTVPKKSDLLLDLRRHFDARRGFTVATINLDHVVKLGRNPEFRQAYSEHSHVTADGNPIVWLSRLAGQHEVTLLPGSELVLPIATLAAEHSVPVGLVGGTEKSLKAAAEAIRDAIPRVNIVLTLAPPMGFDPNSAMADEAISQIASSEARLVFLAFGAPKQEIFAARAQKALKETGFLSIGAGLDFISGSQTRAPKWVRAVAAEWLWRMLSNPRRFCTRYLVCMLALPRLTLRAYVTGRRT